METVRVEQADPGAELAALNPPHGGVLANPLATPDRAIELQSASRDWLSWELTPRQLCDLELLLNGGFSPLLGFLGRADYESICSRMRLASGLLWPIPVVLDLPAALAPQLERNPHLALRDPEGVMLAAIDVKEIWHPDRKAEAEAVFGTTSSEHPGVDALLNRTHPFYVTGHLEGLRLPVHHDFQSLRLTPAQLRAEFAGLGWSRVVAFQTRNPMHRAHFELTRRAAKQANANLLIHPSVGMTQSGDVDHYTRVRCYRALLTHFAPDTARLALLPLAMRMGGPREALWHAIIRKNFGCSHFIVGRDHAGPSRGASGKPFYGPYAAQELLAQHEAELGVHMIPFRNMVYLSESDAYVPEDEVPRGARTASISGTELRRRLAEGAEIPEWFTFPEIAGELRRTYRQRANQGFTVFLTGLSGAGKSSIANGLLVKFLEIGGRRVTLLDGDIVRKNLSSELGFSRADRDTNIRRIGFVAAEVTKHGGIAICAPIAPFDSVREEVRAMVEAAGGGFVLVHVSTPLGVCEQRDRKGLYAKARAGMIPQFTGISDPYEEPADAEVTIDTSEMPLEAAISAILKRMKQCGYMKAEDEAVPVALAPQKAVAAEKWRG
jgi:sulfate adenylyltransferase